jgi:RHS repeat-associated protein
LREYRTDDDEQPISKIKYTGNTTGGKEPYNAIHFGYVTRNDVNTTWPAGKEITTDQLLESIEVISQGAFAGKYTFSYQCSLFSFLTTVTQTGCGGEELNQTVCNYGFGTKSFNKETKYHSDLYTNPYYFYYGDFNGDGKTDFVTVPVKSSYTTSDKRRLYCSNETGTDFEFITESILPNGFQTYYTGDFNGDGMDDLLVTFKYENSWYYQVSFSNGEGFSSIGHGPAKIFDFENEIFVSDFDGDGIDDYMVKRNVKLSGEKDWYIYSFGYNNNLQTLIQLKSSGNIDSWGDNVYERYGVYGLNSEYAIDFNGNGKKELLILDQTGYKVYEFGLTASLILNGSTPNSWDGIYLGDYNGDGKTDMVFEDMPEQNFRMYYSTGNEFMERPTNIGSEIGKGIYQGDFNGDGKTDILTFNIENYQIKYTIAYAESDGEFIFETFESGYSSGYYNNDAVVAPLDPYDTYTMILAYLAPVQLNGDSFTDLIIPFCRMQQSNQLITYKVNPGYNNKLLAGITDGFQNTTAFHYSPVTDNSIYTKGSGAEFPLYDYQGTSYVVNEMIIPNGAGGTTSFAHTYEEAKVHRQGKGFLGFTKNTVINSNTGKKVETTRDLNETFYFPFVSATKVFINDNLQDSISNIPGINDFGDKRFFSYISESREFDKLHGLTTVSTATYDDYGNTLTINVDYNGDAGTQTTNTYTSFGTWWCQKSRLQQSSVTKTRTGESDFTAATHFDYNTQGALTSRKSFYTQPKEVTESFTSFDNFGNPQTVTVSADGLDSRQTLLEYDGYGRFVTKSTNPLGHETALTYDNKTGNLLTQTDANDLMTRYDYDGFGRLEEITRPDGNTTAITREWAVSGNQLYYAKEVTGGQPEKRVYLDVLGRTLKTGVAGFDGALVYIENQYDSNGRLWKTSEPHTGTASHYTVLNYLDDGRIDKITRPNGVIEDYIYTPNSTETKISSSNGMWKNTQTDGSGALIMAEDAGGRIDYTYYAHGGVKNISYSGNSISMTYDAYGRQETLSDPDAGTINYTYNAFGELTNQTDARGNSYNMSYDKLGRITEKKLGTTTVADYNYDTAPGKGIGQLVSVQGDNNITYSYEYDNLGRPVKKTENIQGRSFTIETSYNGYSQVNQVKYPGTAAYTVDNLYQNGYISAVKGTYTTTDDIFTATGYNQRGQVTGYTLGNGRSTTRGYDDFGFPTTIQTPGIQNLEYEFDTQTGNLNWRKDVAKTLQESFTYDNLMKNRLETWQVGSGTTFTNQYTSNGNIDSKTWLGSYQYESARPHAVTGVDNTDGWIVDTYDQTVDYTPFNKVRTIREGDYKLEIIYGPDNQRKKTVLYRDDNSPVPLNSTRDVINWVPYKTKYFVGGIYEEELVEALTDNTSEINYVSGGDGLAAIFVKDDQGENLYYIHKDHLGSYQAVTDESGALKEELYFSPWGNRGSATTWSYPLSQNEGFYGRGFTGHEHLPEFNLINMNGRVYDPILGRFLSPDNYIQAPDYTQNLNRYSYCLNNPLVYTDPSGEFVLELLASVVGGYIIGGLHNWINRDMPFKEAFALRNNYIVSQLNISSDGSVSNPLVDAHNEPKQDRERRKKVEEEIVNVRRAYGESWIISSYDNAFISSRDATLVIPQFYSGSPLQENNNVFGFGDAISVYNTIMPENKRIPYVGHILTGIDVYDHIKAGNYTEATWSFIESAGGIYSVGFKGLAYGYNSNYMQTEIGRGFYKDYIYNLNLYRQTNNEKYLNNAIYYERLMRKTYNNIQRK